MRFKCTRGLNVELSRPRSAARGCFQYLVIWAIWDPRCSKVSHLEIWNSPGQAHIVNPMFVNHKLVQTKTGSPGGLFPVRNEFDGLGFKIVQNSQVVLLQKIAQYDPEPGLGLEIAQLWEAVTCSTQKFHNAYQVASTTQPRNCTNFHPRLADRCMCL